MKFDLIAKELCKRYGNSTVARLLTKGGNVIPKCYIHYSSNTIFTTDKKKANKYTYIEL